MKGPAGAIALSSESPKVLTKSPGTPSVGEMKGSKKQVPGHPQEIKAQCQGYEWV